VQAQAAGVAIASRHMMPAIFYAIMMIIDTYAAATPMPLVII